MAIAGHSRFGPVALRLDARVGDYAAECSTRCYLLLVGHQPYCGTPQTARKSTASDCGYLHSAAGLVDDGER